MTAGQEFEAELRTETTTIMFADVVESVRLIEQDELENVKRIQSMLRQLALDVIRHCEGTVSERRGDGLVVRFSSPRDAARCSLRMHACCQSHTSTDNQALKLRIGINTADVLLDDHGIYGREVNVAARLAALASDGGTVVSISVFDQLTPGIDGHLRDLGECYLKHVREPVRAFSLSDSNREVSQIAVRDRTTPQVHPDAASVVELLTSLAVLPFEPYDAYARDRLDIGDILSDQITAMMSRSASLNVVSRLSTQAYRGRSFEMSSVQERLGAHYVVSGRFLERGDRVIVNVELARCRTGQMLWAERFEAGRDAVLVADSELVGGIVSGISDAIRSIAVFDSAHSPMPNVPSYTLYLAAITLLHRFSKSDFASAQQILLTLHERAPKHVGPLAWLARWHVFKVVQGWTHDVSRESMHAKSLSERALELNPESSLALTIAGSVETQLLKNFANAKKHFAKALANTPSDSLAWLLSGNLDSFSGNGPLAVEKTARATRLSPLDPWSFFFKTISASASLSAGRNEEALRDARASCDLNRLHPSTLRVRAIAAELLGEHTEARESVNALRVLLPMYTVERFLQSASGANDALVAKFSSALVSAGLPRHISNAQMN